MISLSSPWCARIVTLLPELYPGLFSHSLLGKALEKRIWELDIINIRDFATDRHKSVDDTPYGGGAGMVLRPDVVGRSLDLVLQKAPNTKLLYLSPRGPTFTQQKAKELAACQDVTFLCGRFEGLDERVIQEYALEEVSLGDFVLCGGDVAAFAMIETIVRILPGVVGKQESLTQDSFEESLLEYPLYTRPSSWKEKVVPDVLLSGDHKKIEQWRQTQAESITQQRRPDLWEVFCQQKRSVS